MTKVVVVGLVIVVALVVAFLSQRRRPAAPTNPTHTDAPSQIDRRDFPRPETPWLVVVFSSATCDSCAQVRSVALPMASDSVEVFDAEVGAEADLHRRYRIDAVPTTVLVDSEGVVRRSFVGPVSTTHLWGAMAELREPGSVPESCAAAPLPPGSTEGQDAVESPSSDT